MSNYSIEQLVSICYDPGIPTDLDVGNISVPELTFRANFVDSLEFGKTYIIYTVNDQSDTVFASILNETEDSYSLDTITDPKELDFINNEIDRVVSELSEEGE